MSTSPHTEGGSGVTTFIGPLLLTPTQAATDLAIGRTKVFELLRSGGAGIRADRLEPEDPLRSPPGLRVPAPPRRTRAPARRPLTFPFARRPFLADTAR